MKGKRKASPVAGAVICAAGSASRMGFNKQLELLGEIPVLLHSLLAFEAAPSVMETVLVTREGDIPVIWDMVREFGIAKVTHILAGGDTRQQSVGIGARVLSGNHQIVAIHDGARPFVTPELIEAVIMDALKTGAAAAAVPVRDTVKFADGNGMVEGTPDRARLWAMQTPQAFSLPRYLAALSDAQRAGVDCTDDCQLFERLGWPVKLVMGQYDNLKLTVPEDFPVAHAVWERRQGGTDG